MSTTLWSNSFHRTLCLMALLYGTLMLYSFQDIIFQTEILTHQFPSLIEKGELIPPLSRNGTFFLAGFLLISTYLVGYRFLADTSRQGLWRWIILISVIGFICAPFDSTDITVYINHGWLQSHYNLNPYAQTVSSINNWTQDAMFRDHWTAIPASYGPVQTLISKWLCMLGNGHYIATVYLFKLLQLFLHLGIAWLLSKLFNDNRALYLYGLNPLILLQHLANVHNDLAMAFLSILAVYCLLKEKYFWVLPCLMGAVLCKYVALLLLPFFVIALYRKAQPVTVLSSSLVSFSIAWLVIMLYHPGEIPFEIHLKSMALPIGSIQHFLSILETGQNGGISALASGLKIFTSLGLIILLGKQLQKTLTEFSTERVIESSVILYLFAICVASPKFGPWYLGMFLPLALLLPQGTFYRELSIVLSVVFTFSIASFGFSNPIVNVIFFCLALYIACKRDFSKVFERSPV